MGCISGLIISIYNPHVQLQVKVYKVQLQGEGGFYYVKRMALISNINIYKKICCWKKQSVKQLNKHFCLRELVVDYQSKLKVVH